MFYCPCLVLQAVVPLASLTPGQEAGQGIPDDVVDPPFGVHLPDAGVQEGVSRPAVPEGLPLGAVALVVAPGDVDADGVVLHFVIPGVVHRHGVEELAPDELGHDLGIAGALGGGALSGEKRVGGHEGLSWGEANYTCSCALSLGKILLEVSFFSDTNRRCRLFWWSMKKYIYNTILN